MQKLENDQEKNRGKKKVFLGFSNFFFVVVKFDLQLFWSIVHSVPYINYVLYF